MRIARLFEKRYGMPSWKHDFHFLDPRVVIVELFYVPRNETSAGGVESSARKEPRAGKIFYVARRILSRSRIIAREFFSGEFHLYIDLTLKGSLIFFGGTGVAKPREFA